MKGQNRAIIFVFLGQSIHANIMTAPIGYKKIKEKMVAKVLMVYVSFLVTAMEELYQNLRIDQFLLLFREPYLVVLFVGFGESE